MKTTPQSTGSRLVTVRRGLITVKVHGNTEHVTHPMIDLYEGKNVRIHDDLSIYTAGGGKRIGTGTLLVRMRANSRPDLTPTLVGRKFNPQNAELCQPCPPSTPPRQETADGQGLA